jgi:ABC-2 type transport system ATP-binding protein
MSGSNSRSISRLGLRVTGAVKRYGQITALDGVSLNIGPGECLGLIGRNGAGKTTLINAICGRLRLDQGSIRRSDSDGAPVGLVPQQVALYPTLSVRENIAYFTAISGVPRRQQAQTINLGLDMAGLADRAGDRVNTLSVGMQRRLNLAAGLLHSPDLLLLDEPTAGVDPQNRVHIWSLIEELKRSGKTILLTSQHLEEVERLSNRIAVIDKGTILAEGDLATLTDASIGHSWRVIADVRRKWGVEEPRQYTRDIVDIGSELSAYLRELQDEGWVISGIRITPPGLEAVFFALVGKEASDD